MSKYELVGIAMRLYEIWEKEGVYGYNPSMKGVQMIPETLIKMFPDGEFEELTDKVWGTMSEYSIIFAGVKFYTLCTPEEFEKAQDI